MISQEKMTVKRALVFVAITFAFTYAMWGLIAINPGGLFPLGSPQATVPYMLGGLSPTIVMFALIKKWGQTKEERAFFRPIVQTANGWKFAIFVTALFFAAYLLIAAIAAERIEPWYMLVVNFPIMVVGGGFEEIGWRGFFQPALEKKLPFWLAAPIVGVIWSAWHIPLWFITGTDQNAMNFYIFAAYCIFLSYILGALQHLTGSVAASVAFHAWANVLFAVFAIAPIFSGKGVLLFSALMAAFAVSATAAACTYKRRGRKS